jgi:hypothetical protein
MLWFVDASTFTFPFVYFDALAVALLLHLLSKPQLGTSIDVTYEKERETQHFHGRAVCNWTPGCLLAVGVQNAEGRRRETAAIAAWPGSRTELVITCMVCP